MLCTAFSTGRATVLLALGSNLALLTVQVAHGGESVSLGTVQSTSTDQQDATQNPLSAPYQAPSRAPLDATQPTSVISQQFIENNMPLTSNYTDVLSIAPSVYAVSPNGPGLSETQIFNVRGFTDGQYNVTFDGIPWGDSNDFTHHSTSYFMDHDLGPMSLDRGPGTAATIGNATFGGTMSITSKDPLGATTVTPYVSGGSFNTQVYGAEFDTGSITKYNGAHMFIDGEALSSDGYLSNMGLTRENLFTKWEQPVSDNTVVTAVAMYNQLTQYIGLGATQAQINTLGPNYGLNNDPTSQAYRGYNYDKIHNDFEYVGVKTVLDSGWTIDNKAYTYAYYHDGFNGEDPNGETPNGTAYSATDVPGQALVNYYRSWGDTFRLTKSLPFGQIEAGVWGDHQANTRRLTEEDFTLGQAYNPVNIGTATLGVDRALDQTLTTVEPFLQVDWKALPGLTLSPGVRYDYFSRHVDAEVDVKSGLPETYTNTYGSVLPSFLAHYEFSPNWTAYAQVAKGFLAPNENFFNRGTGANLSQTTLQPQQTWNYQLGSNWQSQRLSLGADIYYIDFNNLIVPNTSGGITTYSNLGGATYRGFEAEGTVYLGSGFSVYANGSVNSSNDKSSDTPLPGAPTGTAAFGVIYNLNGWYVSLLDKWVGDLYGDTGRSIPIRNYSILNGALNYTFEGNLFGSSKPSIKLSFNNLLDSTRIYALAGYTVAANTPLYWTIPGRSVFAVLTVPF